MGPVDRRRFLEILGAASGGLFLAPWPSMGPPTPEGWRILGVDVARGPDQAAIIETTFVQDVVNCRCTAVPIDDGRLEEIARRMAEAASRHLDRVIVEVLRGEVEP